MPARVGAPRGVGSIPGLGNSPGEGNGCLLQYSCLGNPVDRGVLWATVHGITKSRTRLILPTLYPHPDEGYRDCRSEKQHWDKASLERAVTVTLRVLSPLLLGEPPAGSRVGGTAAAPLPTAPPSAVNPWGSWRQGQNPCKEGRDFGLGYRSLLPRALDWWAVGASLEWTDRRS